MKFSVIITAKNEEKSIARCLESIKKQANDRVIEIILVDDNSSDKTVKIAKKFAIKVISASSNMGASYCRNLAIRKSSGKYLVFLDAHLYLRTNLFDVVEKWFEKNPKVTAVSGFYNSLKRSDFNYTRDLIREVFRENKEDNIEISFTNFTTFSLCIAAVRKEAFETCLFQESYNDCVNEDSLFQLILMNKGHKFVHLFNIKGWHDARLNKQNLIKKIIYQARGFNKLLDSISALSLKRVPFSPFLFDFPISFLVMIPITAAYMFFKNKIFVIILLTLFFIDFYKIWKLFFQKGYSLMQKVMTAIYIIFNELAKTLYFFIFLFRRRCCARRIIYVMKLFILWELCKIKIIEIKL